MISSLPIHQQYKKLIQLRILITKLYGEEELKRFKKLLKSYKTQEPALDKRIKLPLFDQLECINLVRAFVEDIRVDYWDPLFNDIEKAEIYYQQADLYKRYLISKYPSK